MATKTQPKTQQAKRWEIQFEKLNKSIIKLPWILQGSLVQIKPPPVAPRAKPRYIWTRKVKHKTETISLSEERSKAFLKAIETNRKVEDTLKRMREVSQQVLLETIPGVKKRAPRKSRKR